MDLWPRESFIENSFEIERQKECILRFMKEYMEQLPYELISSILSHLPIEHLVPFLSLHGLPLIRQVVVSDYFSQSITLIFHDPIPWINDLTIEEEEERSILDNDIMNCKDNVYDQKRILRLRKSGNCIYFKSSSRYIKWSHNFQFTSIPLINEILRQDDLKFKHLHIIGHTKNFFRLLSRKSSKCIINNSEKVQISLWDQIKYGIKSNEKNVQLIKSSESLKIRIQLSRFDPLMINNLSELTIIDVKVDYWSSFRFGKNLKCVKLSCIAFLPIQLINFPIGLQQLSIMDAVVINVLDAKFPPSLTHLQFRNCELDNDYILLFWLNHLTNLRNLKLQYNYCFPGGQQNLILPNFSRNQVINWPKQLEVFYFDSIVTISNGINSEKVNLLNNIIWPNKLRRLKLQFNSLFEFNVFKFPDSLTELILIAKEPQDDRVTVSPRSIEFPDSLKRLYIFGYDLLNEVLSFPPNLLELNLVDCKNVDFTAMEFPPSLKFLIIERCDFKYVNDYPYWKELINLEYLSLSGNDITSIDDWNPPPNLKHLLLARNRIGQQADNTIICDECNLHLPSSIKVYMLGNDFIRIPLFKCSRNVDPDAKLIGVVG